MQFSVLPCESFVEFDEVGPFFCGTTLQLALPLIHPFWIRMASHTLSYHHYKFNNSNPLHSQTQSLHHLLPACSNNIHLPSYNSTSSSSNVLALFSLSL